MGKIQVQTGDLRLVLQYFSAKLEINSKNRDFLLTEYYHAVMGRTTDVLTKESSSSGITALKRKPTIDEELSKTKIMKEMVLNSKGRRRLLFEAGVHIIIAAILNPEECCATLIKLYAMYYLNSHGWEMHYQYLENKYRSTLYEITIKKKRHDIEGWLARIERELSAICSRRTEDITSEDIKKDFERRARALSRALTRANEEGTRV